MIRNTLLLICLFIHFQSTCQVTGTVIIGAIASDGIVIAVDSRAHIVGNNEEPLISFDSICKITFINNFPLALYGRGYQYHEAAKNYNNMYPNDTDIEKTFIDFRNYLLLNGLDSTSKFISGGYKNGKPELIGFWKDGIVSSDGYLPSDTTIFPEIRKISNGKFYTSDELKNMLPKMIYDFAKRTHQESKVGGPIAVIKINENNKVEWLQNNFCNSDILDCRILIKKLENRQIKTTNLVDGGLEKAIEITKSNCLH